MVVQVHQVLCELHMKYIVSDETVVVAAEDYELICAGLWSDNLVDWMVRVSSQAARDISEMTPEVACSVFCHENHTPPKEGEIMVKDALLVYFKEIVYWSASLHLQYCDDLYLYASNFWQPVEGQIVQPEVIGTVPVTLAVEKFPAPKVSIALWWSFRRLIAISKKFNTNAYNREPTLSTNTVRVMCLMPFCSC